MVSARSFIPLALAALSFGAPLGVRPVADGVAEMRLEWRPDGSHRDLVAVSTGGGLIAAAALLPPGPPSEPTGADGVLRSGVDGDRGTIHFAAVPIWEGAEPRGELVLARLPAGEGGVDLPVWSALIDVNGSPTQLRLSAAGETVAAGARDLQTHPGQPLPGLDADRLAAFDAGRTEFDRMIGVRDGLGPAFNDQSCFNCHRHSGAGGFSERRVTHFARVAEPASDLRELGGPVLQGRGLGRAVEELLPAEADVQADRITPHLFGIGLVEALPDGALEALAAAQPEAQRGRVHWGEPLEGGGPRAGRFGWKSQFATLLSFTADALREELGQTNRLLPDESLPNGDFIAMVAADRVPDPEVRAGADGVDRLDRLVDFQRLLAPPPQTPSAGHPGEAVFERIGCAVCHQPRLTLPDDAPEPFAGRAFAPYSDFLLHDLAGDADGIPTGDAGATEMRTAPLWGLLGRSFFWHDGTISRSPLDEMIEATVARHGGQGAAAREAWGGLEPSDRRAVLDFLATLGRHPHDLDASGAVDFDDGRALAAVLGDPGAVRGTPATNWAVLLDVSGNGALEPEEVVAFMATIARSPERRAELTRRRRR